MPIEIKDQNVTAALIPLVSPIEISGTVHFNDTSKLAGQPIMITDAEAVFPMSTGVDIEEDGTFHTTVRPGRYIVSVRVKSADHSYVKSITLGDRDVLGKIIDFSQSALGPIEIAISKGAGRVDGSLEQPTPGALIALIADPPRLDLSLTALADQSGHFSFPNVPPANIMPWLLLILKWAPGKTRISSSKSKVSAWK